MDCVLKKISKIGIVPVVVINDAADAEPVAKALYEGGIPCAEVTFRTDAAEESIRLMAKAYPQMLIGAGTILTIDQTKRAVNAGAKFIVSPGLNPKVVQYCLDNKISVTPGVSNPTDIEVALEMGLDVVKFFPAEASGGLKAIKAMAAPYTSMHFMPTGGIDEKNLNDYLAFPKIIACGGSWMVNSDLIKNKEFDKMKELTNKAVLAMLGFEIKHVGVNFDQDEVARSGAFDFAGLFGFETKEGNSSIFAGSVFEAMKTGALGKNGHIAMGTNHIERAMEYMESKRVEFDLDTAKYLNGKLNAIYMKQEIGGMAIHLLQK